MADAGTGLRQDNLGKVLNPGMVEEIKQKGGAAEKRLAGIIEFHNVQLASQHIIYAERGIKIVKEYLRRCNGLIKEKAHSLYAHLLCP